MSEILTIRLNSDPRENIPWLIWSPNQQEVIASGDVDHIAQLSPYSKDREVIVLADSSAITMMSVAIPPGTGRQLENVLPFLLEDELAQDVSQVHVALLDKSETHAFVAIIEHKVLQEWMAGLSQANLQARRIIPDCLCLPYDGSNFSAVNFHDRWIFRTDKAQGFSAETPWLDIVLKSLQDQSEEPLPTITSFSQVPEKSNFTWRNEPAMLVMEIFARGIKDNNFTLLTGRYKPSTQYTKYIRYWRDAGIAAALLFCVLGVEQAVNIVRMENQAKVLNEETLQLAKSVLPQNQRIPTSSYLKRVIDAELSRLAGSGSGVSFLGFLAEIIPILKTSAGIEIGSFRFDQGRNELRFNAKGKDFADFEKLRSAFSEKFKTELGRLNRDEKIVSGDFVLQKE